MSNNVPQKQHKYESEFEWIQILCSEEKDTKRDEGTDTSVITLTDETTSAQGSVVR